MPKQVPKLLRNLRAPAPIEVEDIEEALISLFDGADKEAEEPRFVYFSFRTLERSSFS